MHRSVCKSCEPKHEADELYNEMRLCSDSCKSEQLAIVRVLEEIRRASAVVMVAVFRAVGPLCAGNIDQRPSSMQRPDTVVGSV